MNDLSQYASTVPVGYIVLSVIMIPVAVMAIGGIATKPRNLVVPAVFTSAVVLLIGGMVLGFAAIGFALKFFVPQ